MMRSERTQFLRSKVRRYFAKQMGMSVGRWVEVESAWRLRGELIR